MADEPVAEDEPATDDIPREIMERPGDFPPGQYRLVVEIGNSRHTDSPPVTNDETACKFFDELIKRTKPEKAYMFDPENKLICTHPAAEPEEPAAEDEPAPEPHVTYTMTIINKFIEAGTQQLFIDAMPEWFEDFQADTELLKLLDDPPVCIITQVPPVDPVMAADGKVYDRIPLLQWWERKQCSHSPSTNMPMRRDLIDMTKLKEILTRTHPAQDIPEFFFCAPEPPATETETETKDLVEIPQEPTFVHLEFGDPENPGSLELLSEPELLPPEMCGRVLHKEELYDYIIETYGAPENRLMFFCVHDNRGPIDGKLYADSVFTVSEEEEYQYYQDNSFANDYIPMTRAEWRLAGRPDGTYASLSEQ
eukprot:SAG11_NODE_6599_length_1280_cov_25.715495_1_plen_365_part_10